MGNFLKKGILYTAAGILSASILFAFNTKRSEAAQIQFTDVTNESVWYYKPVYWAAENGITSGSDGKFFPSDNCTREQTITFLWRLAGKPQPKSMTSNFSDVKDSRRYSYKAIMWGSENGIITGTGGKFYPTGTCTREQVVTMVWRYAGKIAPKSMSSKFRDVTDSKRYSYKAVLWAQENGIATGTNGIFSPTGECKRRDIVAFIYRYSNIATNNSGWKTESGKKYYYSGGKKIKGLQKIDDTWYLFDDKTGEYKNESGKKLYLASFFGSDNGYEPVEKYSTYNTKAYKFFTFDGKKLFALKNADYTYNSVWPVERDSSEYKSIFTQHGGRDSSVLMKDGMFYTVFTGVSSEKGSVRDFTILNTTDFITYSWGAPSTHYEYAFSKNSSGEEYRRWSPEWFYDEDTGKSYVFYCAQYKDDGKMALYMTQYKDDFPYAMNPTYEFTTPVRITLNGAPKVDDSEVKKGAPQTKPIDNLIGPSVIKVNGSYYLLAKREAWKSNDSKIKNLQASLVVYKAKDSTLKNWDYFYEFDNFKLPFNNGASYDYYTAEGPLIKYINGEYILYMDVYHTKDRINYYEGTHYFTSKDMTKSDSWVYGGKLTADYQFGYKNLRSGSISEITDAKSADVVKTIYNGTVDVPDVKLNYTGSEQNFLKYLGIFWGKPVGSQYYEVKDGTWKATEKGEYSVTVELKSDKIKWADNGNKRREIKWSIV